MNPLLVMLSIGGTVYLCVVVFCFYVLRGYEIGRVKQ